MSACPTRSWTRPIRFFVLSSMPDTVATTNLVTLARICHDGEIHRNVQSQQLVREPRREQSGDAQEPSVNPGQQRQAGGDDRLDQSDLDLQESKNDLDVQQSKNDADVQESENDPDVQESKDDADAQQPKSERADQ